LYLRMARAAEVLRPLLVAIENVVAVQRDTGDVVGRTRSALERAGYTVAGSVVDLARVGVPQRRRRYLLLASRIPTIDPGSILARLEAAFADHPARTVEWAIGDLRSVLVKSTFDSAGRTTK